MTRSKQEVIFMSKQPPMLGKHKTKVKFSITSKQQSKKPVQIPDSSAMDDYKVTNRPFNGC